MSVGVLSIASQLFTILFCVGTFFSISTAAESAEVSDSTEAVEMADSVESAEAPPHWLPATTDTVYRKVRSIPYPQRSLYVSSGLLAGIGIGKFQSERDPQSQYQWQGEISYFYTPWFSGGAVGRIIAGQPSDSVDRVHNRYMLMARLHASSQRTAVFSGLQLGLDNQVLHHGQSIDSVDEDRINLSNTANERTLPSLAMEIGAGWKPLGWIGATAGASMDYVLYDPLMTRMSTGVSIDMLAFWPNFRDVVSSFYLSLEYQRGLLLAERAALGFLDEQSFVVGLGLAF